MNMIEKRKAMAGQGGFTLIELLVVIAILAVLGGAVIIGIGAMRGNAQEEVCKTNKETIETAAEAFNLDTGAYPADVAALTTAALIKPGTIPAGQTWAISGTGVATVTAGLPAAVMTACNA